jgi:hypothetical protein
MAIKALKDTVFVPAKRGTEPVDAGFAARFKFELWNNVRARKEFIGSYNDFKEAVDAADRATADGLLARLEASNLYEEAFRNLALFSYHKRWGTETQQIADLTSAIAYESGQIRYLGSEGYIAAASALLVLHVKGRNYGEALNVWRAMSRLAPQASLEPLAPLVAELEKRRTSGEATRLAGSIDKGTSWFNSLFTRNFEIQVHSGRVSELKLRCEKNYLFFTYEPGVRYTVKGRDGACRLEVVGETGTRFDLVQS